MPILEIAILLAAGALVILAASALSGIAAKLWPGNAIVAALQPYVAQAVFAGQTAALRALEQAEERLRAIDRTAIFSAAYHALPSMIGPFPVSLVKRFVSEDQWLALGDSVYNSSIAFLDQNEAYLTDQRNLLVKPADVLTYQPSDGETGARGEHAV